MNAVIIDNNTNLVVNVIKLLPESDYTPPTGFTKIFNDSAQIGWFWNGSVFSPPVSPPPAPTVPDVITKRQFIIAAWRAGIITQQEALQASNTVPTAIEAAFSSLPTDVAIAARITWSNMTIIPRNDSLMEGVAASLNMTSEEIDQFFINAGAIE